MTNKYHWKFLYIFRRKICSLTYQHYYVTMSILRLYNLVKISLCVWLLLVKITYSRIIRILKKNVPQVVSHYHPLRSPVCSCIFGSVSLCREPTDQPATARPISRSRWSRSSRALVTLVLLSRFNLNRVVVRSVASRSNLNFTVSLQRARARALPPSFLSLSYAASPLPPPRDYLPVAYVRTAPSVPPSLPAALVQHLSLSPVLSPSRKSTSVSSHDLRAPVCITNCFRPQDASYQVRGRRRRVRNT